MSTLYTMPGFTGPHDVSPDARRTYGADGLDYGYLCPREGVRAMAEREECDPDTDTITVWLPDDL